MIMVAISLKKNVLIILTISPFIHWTSILIILRKYYHQNIKELITILYTVVLYHKNLLVSTSLLESIGQF